LDLARSVVDDRLLIEGEVLEEALGILEARAEEVVRGHGADESDDAEQQEAAEEDDGEGNFRASSGAASRPGMPAVASVTLPTRKAGLHVPAHSSMGSVILRPPTHWPIETSRRRLL